MISPSNGRGLLPKVRSTTAHLWTMDAVASPDLAPSGTALTNPGGLSAPTNAVGRMGNANQFNGTLNYLTGPTGEHANFQAAYTIELWVQPHYSQAGASGLIAYGASGAGGALAVNTQLEIQYNVDRTLTWRWEHGAGVDVEQTTTGSLSPYQWNHIAFARSATSGGTCTVTVYINGEATDTYALQVVSAGGTDATVFWYVGALQGPTGYFKGNINCVAMHKEELFPDAILESFRRGMQWEPGNFDTHLKVVGSQYDFISATPVTPDSIEFTNFFGRDWVESVEISKTVDATCATATISLFRDVFKQTLAADMEQSPYNLFDNSAVSPGFGERPNPDAPGPDDLTYSPAIQNWRLFEIYAARTPIGVAPGSADYQSIFKGRLDRFDWAGDVVKLRLRDEAGAIEDFFIEDEGSDFGGTTAAPVALVTAINNLFTARWTGMVRPSAAPQVFAPYDPTFNIDTPWLTTFESFMDHVLPLADMIGWSLGMKFNPFTSAWEWTLTDPYRTRIGVDGVIEPGDVLSFQSLSEDLTSVRNVVRLGYVDNNGRQRTVTRSETDLPPFTDTGTQLYGRRFISISQKATEQINDSTEANTMADAILYDLLLPYAEKSVTMKAFWELEINDRLSFQPDDIHFSTVYTASVSSVRHQFKQGGAATTQLMLRGRSASAYSRHIDKGGGPRTGVRIPPGSLENVTTDVGYIPKRIPFQSFLDMGLPTSVIGDASISSANPYFAIHPDYDANMVPGWTVVSGSIWGSTNDVYWDRTNSESGDVTIKLMTAGSGIESALFLPVIGTRCLRVAVRWTGTNAADQLNAEIEWFDRDRASLGSAAAFSATITTTGTFETSVGVLSPPSNARFYKVSLEQANPAPGIIYIDRVLVTPMNPSFFVYMGSDMTGLSAGTVTVAQVVDSGSGAYDYCNNWDNTSYDFTVPEEGRYAFRGKITFVGNPSGTKIDNAHVYLYKNGSAWLDVEEVEYDGGGSRGSIQIIFSTPAIELNGGDVITLRGKVNTDDFDMKGGIDKTWMSGELITGRYG